MNKIRVNSVIEIPKDYTGIVLYPDLATYWYKEGKLHRIDGPAYEEGEYGGMKAWFIDGVQYYEIIDVTNKPFLGKEKGKYGLVWLRFLTEEGVKEYPILSGLSYRYYTTDIDDLK